MKTKLHITLTTSILLLILIGCNDRYLKNDTDVNAGFNGDFEFVKDNFPANWQINAIPVKKGYVKFEFDKKDAKSGENALKLISSKVIKTNKFWKKPGLQNEIKIIPGKKYKISVWLKNENSDIGLKWLTYSNQKKELRSSEFIKTDISFPVWYFFKEELIAEQNEEILALQIYMNKPGIIWVDKIKIEEIP